MFLPTGFNGYERNDRKINFKDDKEEPKITGKAILAKHTKINAPVT